MIEFTCHENCSFCPRHEDASSIAIPTRRASLPPPPTDLPGNPALLIIGEAPGPQEDACGASFVGPTGMDLHKSYLKAMGLDTLATVYLANAVRCYSGRKPTESTVAHCRLWLADDIATICRDHPSLTILCCGKHAARAALNMGLKDATKHQGTVLPDIWATLLPTDTHTNIRVFSTNHPAYLMAGRNPSAARNVFDHLALVVAHLTGARPIDTALPSTSYTTPFCNQGTQRLRLPDYDDSFHGTPWLSLDIETYGILKKYKQTVFHPRKAAQWDGIPTSEMIRTVSIAWHHADPTCSHSLKGHTLLWANPKHRAYLFNVLADLHIKGGALLGTNLPFDIQFLRYCCPRLRIPLVPYGIQLIDLTTLSYLLYELRIDNSLKGLSQLFGITVYDHLDCDYESDLDPELLAYNQQDASATLLTIDYVISQIQSQFGEDSNKLTPYNFNIFSDALWSIIHMAESGVPFSGPRLRTIHNRCTHNMERLSDAYTTRYGAPLRGKGSGTLRDAFFTEVAETLDLLDDPRLEFTKETKAVSTARNNLNLFVEVAQPRSDIGRQLSLIKRFKTYEKIVGSYTRPILDGSMTPRGWSNASRMVRGIVYPSWFAVPSGIKDTTSDTSGGTVQGRWSAKHPAIQTDPKIIHRCIVSRWPGGIIGHWDYSQMELRIAALLSGDTCMLASYADLTCDFHEATLCSIRGLSPEEARKLPNYSDLRWAAKQVNFGMIYGATALRLQTTLREDVGLDWPLPDVERAIAIMKFQWSGLMSFQRTLLHEAQTTNRISLPLVGHTRTFEGSPKTVRLTYYNEILNFPIQTMAALILQNAQAAITRQLVANNYRSVLILNCHDAIELDIHPSEVNDITSLVEAALPCPPLFRDLCSHLGRTVPLVHESMMT